MFPSQKQVFDIRHSGGSYSKRSRKMETLVFALLVVLFVVLALLPLAAYLFFLCGTFLEEGTGKLALKLGAYCKTLVAKTGFTIDAEGTIVPGYEKHLLGGWRWVGLWPFYRVFKKRMFRWAKVKVNDKGVHVVEEKEESNVSKLLVRFYVYGFQSVNAEDSNLVPVNSLWSITAWTSNLKRAWLDTEDWFGALRSRILPYIRHHVSLHTYQDIIAKDDVRLDIEVKDTLTAEGILDELCNRHGIHVIAIECVDISPDEKFRVDTLKKWQADREAKAELVKQRVGAMSFAAETSGREISMISKWLGIPVKKLQTELRAAITADPANGFENWLKKYPVVQKNWNLIQQKQLGVRPNLFGNADGTPLDPVLAGIAALISLAKSSNNLAANSPSGPAGNPAGGQGTQGQQGGGNLTPPPPGMI